MRKTNRFFISTLAAALCLMTWTGTCQASIFSLTGDVGAFPVDVSANFTSSGDTLTIALSNKLATQDASVILTNVEWSLNAPGTHPTLSLNSIAYGSGTELFDTQSTSSTPPLITSTYNMWGLGQNPNGQLGQGKTAFFTNEYGVSSIGGGLAAFVGNSGPIADPKPSLDGDDYGIVGPGTDLSKNTFNAKFPLVKNTGSGDSTLIFTITGFTGFDASQVTDVHFSFGSDPTIVSAIPEPSTLAIAGLGALGFVGYGLRRRLKK